MLFNHLRSFQKDRTTKIRRFATEPLERRMLLSGAGPLGTAGLSPLSHGQVGVIYVDSVWAGSVQGASVSDPNAWFGPGPFTFGVNAFATVQDGANHVAPGGTVDVAAGTYSENVIVSQHLTLNGAKMGVSGTNPGRGGGGETLISAGSGTVVTVNTPSVIINGIAITGNIGISATSVVTIQDDFVSTTGTAISIGAVAGDVIVQDDGIVSSGGAGVAYEALAAAGAPSSTANLTISNSVINSYQGTGIGIGGGTQGTIMNRVTISGDTVGGAGPDVSIGGNNVSIGRLAIDNNNLSLNVNSTASGIVIEADGNLTLGDHSSISGNGVSGEVFVPSAAIQLRADLGNIALGDGFAIDDNIVPGPSDFSFPFGIQIVAASLGDPGATDTQGTFTFGRADRDSVDISGNNVSALTGIAIGARDFVLNSPLNIGKDGHGNILSSPQGISMDASTATGKPVNIVGNSTTAPIHGVFLSGDWSAPVNISDNTFSVGDGIDVYSGGWSGPISIAGNRITTNGVGINLEGYFPPISSAGFTGPIDISSNIITFTAGLGGADGTCGIIIQNAPSQTTIEHNQIAGGTSVGIDLGPGGGMGDSNVSIIGNDIRNNSAEGILVEPGVYGGFGISILNNFIENNGTGVLVQSGASGQITINYNSIGQDVSYGYPGNTVAGLDNESTIVVDARFNWWGDASGPSGIGPGTGDKIIGSNVNFAAWLTNGADADAPNRGDGFQPIPLRRRHAP